MTSLEFEPFFEDINENKSNHKRNKEKIKVAFELAKEKHKYQKRRMSDDPYFVHPLRTAKLLRDFDDDLIIAGLLHDIVEDTQTSGEEVKAMFGESIHFLVEAVTKDELTDPVQKVIEFSQKDKRVILLKIADRLDNMNDNIENMGIKTKSKYIKQNQQLLEFMQSIDEMYFYDKLKNLTNKLANLVGSDLSA